MGTQKTLFPEVEHERPGKPKADLPERARRLIARMDNWQAEMNEAENGRLPVERLRGVVWNLVVLLIDIGYFRDRSHSFREMRADWEDWIPFDVYQRRIMDGMDGFRRTLKHITEGGAQTMEEAKQRNRDSFRTFIADVKAALAASTHV